MQRSPREHLDGIQISCISYRESGWNASLAISVNEWKWEQFSFYKILSFRCIGALITRISFDDTRGSDWLESPLVDCIVDTGQNE
jgi:hypothetical protein